jgi:hypothetical protein
MKNFFHRVIFPAAFHACGGGRQIVVTEHRISVPVYRTAGQQATTTSTSTATTTPCIDVAFSIVEEVIDEASRKWFESLQIMSPSERAQAYIDKAALVNADDMLLYLQGGPGFGSPVPVVSLAFSKGSSWGGAALNKYKRIVLMDQRGTGQSTPITKQSLQRRFPDLFLLDNLVVSSSSSSSSPSSSSSGDDETTDIDTAMTTHPDEASKFQIALREATNFMAQFRADNIVKDAEMIKEALLLPLPKLSEEGIKPTTTTTTTDPPGAAAVVPRPWGCSLGQSYGGFCTMTYLSLMDHPPQVALLTGGIAPLGVHPFDLYTALWTKVKERNIQYYSMYPGDIAVVKKIVQKLLSQPQKLPSGGTLTARRFLQLGMMLGGGPSSFASMHTIVSTAFLIVPSSDDDDTTTIEFTRAFLKGMDNAQPFDEHPIYYWLHESIYADGPKFSPTNWSAHRAYQAKITTTTTTTSQSEFDYKITSSVLSDDSQPTLFFGEMVFPWMAQDYVECYGVGCTALANELAQKSDWDHLYDADHMRTVLADGRTRCAAAVYYDDIYVHFDSCMKVVSSNSGGSPMDKCKVYITNEYQHSGLRDDGANLFDKLHGMATGSVRTPS